jgi:hypothetical protein
MATAQEQYTEYVKQSQDAVQSAVDTWTKTVQDAFGQLPSTLPTTPTSIDPEQVIDQVFDFAASLLGAQREFAKNLVHTSTSLAETVRQSATRTVEAQEG